MVPICLSIAFSVLFGTEAFADDIKPVETVRSVNGICSVVLEAAVRENCFPAAGAGWNLRSPVYVLREANGEIKGISSLVGPIIRVGKGDTLKIRIDNCLDPALLPFDAPHPAEDYPHGWAATNLHTHGLHVSPRGKADNIYVEIEPNCSHQFEYQIVPNHVAGTFWYHPHKHGSVALQLTGGMAGALIVDGDLDDIPEIKGACEQILVLQQFHGQPLNGSQTVLQAQPGDIYDKIAGANAAAANQRAPKNTWRFRSALQKLQMQNKSKLSGRNPSTNAAPSFTCEPHTQDPGSTKEWLLVNGQFAPTIHMKGDEVQRFRFVHAGLDELVNVAVVGDANGIEQHHDLWEIAVDGIPRGRRVCRQSNLMYPGYRWDVLFKAPHVPGNTPITLCLIDEAAPGSVTLSGLDKPRQMIAKIVVDGNGKQMNFPTDDTLKQCVPTEFRTPISDREVGNRRWGLKFDFPDHGDQVPAQLLINGSEYSHKIDRAVRLNTAEEWRIESGTGVKNSAGHPFHVHVNPFLHYRYRSILSLNIGVAPGKNPVLSGSTKLTDLGFDPQDVLTFSAKLRTGKSFNDLPITADDQTLQQVSDSIAAWLGTPFDAKTDCTDLSGRTRVMVIRGAGIEDLVVSVSSKPSSQAALAFVRDHELIDLIWRDTLLAPAGRSEIVRIRFRDWPGESVLHCHIVDHEDQGMMKNIRILCPDERLPDEDAEVGKHGSSGTTRALPAPGFTLPDAAGKQHALNDFAGKAVILVFFRDFGCPHCAKQLQAYRAMEDALRKADVAIVAISSAEFDGLRPAASAEAGKPGSLLVLVDPTLKVFQRYGCRSPSTREAEHGTFIVDRQGRIRWKDVGAEPYMNVQRVFEEARRTDVLAPPAFAAK
jgi:FtsP/CotA-like multicopper oxidase with cupredoxin domain/peroxiredoxin